MWVVCDYDKHGNSDTGTTSNLLMHLFVDIVPLLVGLCLLETPYKGVVSLPAPFAH